MSIMSKIHKDIIVYSKNAPASDKEIDLLVKFSDLKVPEDYIQLVKQATEVEFILTKDTFLRIWGPLESIDMNEAYYIQNYIPESLAIGDNEAGEVILYYQGNEGFGLYIVGFGDLDPDSLVFISKSINDLLMNKEGLDILIN